MRQLLDCAGKAQRRPLHYPQIGLLIRRIPKGFRNKAQGCEARATLGQPGQRSTTPTGLRHATPCHNPVGVGYGIAHISQGSSCLATLGGRSQSLWDWPQPLAKLWVMERRQRSFRADGAFRHFNPLGACKSGVALRFPPQSKKARGPRTSPFAISKPGGKCPPDTSGARRCVENRCKRVFHPGWRADGCHSAIRPRRAEG